MYLSRNKRKMNYWKAETILGNRQEIKVCHETRLVKLSEDSIGLKYWYTYVVIWNRDGSIELDSGGWDTHSTKSRINDFLEYGIGTVYQKNFEWYFAPKYDFDNVIEFIDGMIINN